MNFTFVVPLLFAEDLPDMIAIAGTTNSVELPEVIVELGYRLNDVIVQPESDQLTDEIYYDQTTHSLVYSPASETLQQAQESVGDYMIAVILIDSEAYEYQYEMKLTLRMPHLYFEADLTTFLITNGVYSE